jgi:hypothetical protein
MGFRKRAEAEQFNEMTSTKQGETHLQPDEHESIWSVANLKKLSIDELEDRLDQVEKQSTLIKWRIWWSIRQKFGENDKAFGKYVQSLRDRSTPPAWLGSPRDITRSIAAGRFCEQHRVSDLNSVKIYKESIYALIEVKDEKIASEILHKIRRTNTVPMDVKKMITDATTVVSTIEKSVPGTVQAMDHEQPEKYTLQVEKSIIHGEVIPEPAQSQQQVTIEPSEPEISPAITESSTALMMQVIAEADEDQVIKNSINRRMNLILELAGEKAAYLTKDQQKEEIKLLVRSYQLSFLSEAGLLQECAKDIAAKGYGK